MPTFNAIFFTLKLKKNITRMCKRFALFIFILCLTTQAHAQSKSFIGMNFTVENGSYNFRPGLGLQFERQITRRSGIETGLYYRTFAQQGTITLNTQPGFINLPFTVAERHISIPVLYKFYARIVNLHIGPTFDFYLGWKQLNKSSSLEVTDYSIDPNFSLGLMTKISKTIRIDEKLTLQPELRLNPIISHGRFYAGFGIMGRYTLK